jgi:hypothetical protein
MIIALFPAAVAAKEPEARTGDWLKKAISTAKSGAVIDIPAGDYDLTDLQISKSLKLVGDPAGGVTFRSAETTEKGILVPLAGVDLYVENISFIGAKSWDRNGAGIRHEGRNLTVSNCRFIANEEGILATGAAAGVIKLLNSEFVDNGFGDGQSHGVYVSSGDRLEVSASRFIGTRIGHHIKSLANTTIVENTVMDDGHGRSSYAIDASKGGDVTIRNNKFIQSADAENYAIINYDLTRGGDAKRLIATGNEIVNYYDGGVFLRNATRLAPSLSENRIENKGKRPIALLAPGSPKAAQ